MVAIFDSSLISKVESRKLAGALDSCFVLFGTLRQCAPTQPGGNRIRDLTVRKPVSNCCVTSARSRLEFSTSPIIDTARIILHCLVCYFHTEDIVGHEIHDFPLDDQLTVDFIHPMSWLLKYFVSSREFGFLTVRSRVQFPPGSIGAHCWKVPNITKQLSSAPAIFRLSTLLINDEFLIENKIILQRQKRFETTRLIELFNQIIYRFHFPQERLRVPSPWWNSDSEIQMLR